MLIERKLSALVFVGALLSGASTLLADGPQDKLHRAYYLESHDENYAAAEKAYAELAADTSLDAATRTEARKRRDACHEEVTAADLTRLMPPAAWAYVELNQPGEQLVRLLDQLGLLRKDQTPTQKIADRFAVSPDLVRELLGIRGVAACVTGFDPGKQAPAGVVVAHPGRMEVIRAALQTALPVQSKPVESIEGFETYEVEGGALVTFTARLIIASQQRGEIEGVIRRLKGDDDESLATQPELAAALAGRDDSLLRGVVNFKPMMPFLQAGLVAASTQEPEIAVAGAVFDLRSLKTLTIKLGAAKDGLFFDAALELQPDHRNLAVEFFRLPPIDVGTLKLVPAGAAGFAALALNPPGAPAAGAPKSDPAKRDQPISAMDIGREIFGNLVSVAAFVLPTATSPGPDGRHIPDCAIVMSSRDVAKSRALWCELLGVASLASRSGPALDGAEMEIEGLPAKRFALPEGVSMFVAVSGNNLLVGPSQAAIAKALAVQRGAKSAIDDSDLAGPVGGLGPDASFAIVAHAGRCLELGKALVSPQDRQEIERFGDMLAKTTACIQLEQGDHRVRLAAKVAGVPDVSGLVTELIRQQRERARFEFTGGADSESELLRSSFETLAADPSQIAAAEEVGRKLLDRWNDNALALNNFAWALVTESRYRNAFNKLAAQMSERSNELTDHENWMFVDTLAHTRFALGQIEEAIQLERKAIELCQDNRRGEAENALRKFEQAKRERTSPQAD